MKLIIVDDDTLVRKSLSLTLKREDDIAIMGEGENGQEAIALCEKFCPDILLMDIRMPIMDGITATSLIKERFPTVKIMILTTFEDKQNIEQALAAGADGYLVKTDKIAAIAGKLRILMEGSGILDASVLKKLTKRSNPLLESLTPREREVARLVAQGLSNKDIAEQLFLSAGTIRNNVAAVMDKFGVSNRTQIAAAYYES